VPRAKADSGTGDFGYRQLSLCMGVVAPGWTQTLAVVCENCTASPRTPPQNGGDLGIDANLLPQGGNWKRCSEIWPAAQTKK